MENMVQSKEEMSEEDIKRLFITPALESKWDKGMITMENKVTDGKIKISGNITTREAPKKADYLLYLAPNYPIAVVEAKNNRCSVALGIQQAKEYAEMLDVPFAYSSNGDAFEEYDFLTGTQKTIPMDEFPTRDELVERYKKGSEQKPALSPAEEQMIAVPYYTSQNTYPPRYYQRIAVNRTLSAIARGQDRILLVMATGTGKTYTAFQLVYRLLQSGTKKKILYLADRNNLVDQSILQDFAPLEKVIYKINFSNASRNKITSHQVYFGLYQQMVGDNGEERFRDYFSPDFFDLIIVDECHRGSAKEESRWRKVLEYFDSAVQIGMTATPKETKYISNIDYFGEPIYKYSLKNGIDDGFLAPFKVINVTTSIGDGWRPQEGQKDADGNLIEDRIYNNKDYDYSIVISDRTEQVAQEITAYLKSTNRMQKTIVFCATEAAAERMAKALINLNQDMMIENSHYVTRITSSDKAGKKQLSLFISPKLEGTIIATTSDLLSTGTDCKLVSLIVLDKNIGSMTQFKQIIGRGTRIREEEGKLSFTVMDFRGVTRLFADPDWDGPVEQQDNFEHGHSSAKTGSGRGIPKKLPVVNKDGCEVKIINRRICYYDTNGKLLHTETIIDYTKTNTLGEYATLDNFVKHWSASKKKEIISHLFEEKGINFNELKKEQNMEDVDDFDFICHIVYDQKPLTRKERAENVKRRDFFHKYGDAAREVLNTLLEQYMNQGITELENISVLKLSPFQKFGKPAKIMMLFGGKEGYLQTVQELEQEIYRIG